MTEAELSRDEDWVTLTTLDDRVQARALGELLENAGIPCATPGAEHRGVLGMLGAYIAIAVQVPRSHEPEARRLYDAFVRPGVEPSPSSSTEATDRRASASAPQGEGPYRETAEEERAEASGPARLRRVAVFVAIWAPLGAGHLYARETAAALVLCVAQLVAVSFAFFGAPTTALGAVLVWLYDIVGSVWAVDRFNRGAPRRASASVPITVGFVLLAHLLAVPLTAWLATSVPPPPRVPPPRAHQERSFPGLPATGRF